MPGNWGLDIAFDGDVGSLFASHAPPNTVNIRHDFTPDNSSAGDLRRRPPSRARRNDPFRKAGIEGCALITGSLIIPSTHPDRTCFFFISAPSETGCA